jgi:hypothetical protein
MPTVDRTIPYTARSTTSLTKEGIIGTGTSFGSNASSVPVTRTRTGTRLPKWREVIANGGNATTGLTAQWDTMEVDNANFTLIEETVSKHPSLWWRRTVTHTGYLPVIEYGAGCARCLSPTLGSSTADNRAAAAFYKKLRATQVLMSGPTFLGELRETLHMLHRPASALYSSAHGYLDALSKAKRASPKHWLKTASGLWLEYSFGWLPLINDTFDAAKAHRSLTKPRQSVISAGGTDSKDQTKTLTWGNGVYAAGNGIAPGNQRSMSVASTAIDYVMVRYKGKIKSQVVTTTWDKWAAFGFTPSEFLPTAWELLPWSFLVDYFTNVGDILTAAVTDTSSVVFVNRSTVSTRKYYGIVRPASTANTNPGTVVTNIGSARFNCVRRLVTRSAGSGVPFPRLQLESGLSNGQLFNVAALLGQARALHGQQSPRNWHR